MKHTKKIITISIISFFCIFSKVSATGAGVQLSGNPGLLINQENIKPERFTGRVIGTIKSGRLPVAAGFGLEGGKLFSDVSYGFTAFADYYALDLQVKNTLNLYSGFGAEGSLLTKNFNDWTVCAGARFFAGINWTMYDNYLEFYIQQNAVPGFIKDLSKSSTKPAFMLGLPLEAGIRMHF